MNSQPTSMPQKAPDTAPLVAGWMSWLSLTRPLLVTRRDHRVLDVDEILLLHVRAPFAHLLGVLFRVEGDENQIAHVCLRFLGSELWARRWS